MDVSVSGLSGCDSDREDRGTSPASLAPFLARLSRDERVGWTSASRSRADDTDSLNVNVSDCGSCRLSEVSSVSSWLNDMSTAGDDYSSGGDETDSEKDDDVDDDADNDSSAGAEVRPMFLLQRCLEEKLLQRQQNVDVCRRDVVDRVVSTELNSAPQNDRSPAETSTIKRASRNLFTFKTLDTEATATTESVDNDGHQLSATNAVISHFSHQPLRRTSSRCNPDSLICTGAIYDFNSSLGRSVLKAVNSCDVQSTNLLVKPQQTMQKSESSGDHSSRISRPDSLDKNTSPVKDVAETSLCLPTVTKTNFLDKPTSVVEGKNKCTVGGTQLSNGSSCHKHSAAAAAVTTANNNVDGTSVKASHVGRPVKQFECRSESPVKSTLPSCADDSLAQSTTPHVNYTDNVDTATDDVEKTSERQCSVEHQCSLEHQCSVEPECSLEHGCSLERACSLAMPAVEDGLSNSDVSDVDEAFSMFGGLKLADPEPLDATFSAASHLHSQHTPHVHVVNA